MNRYYRWVYPLVLLLALSACRRQVSTECEVVECAAPIPFGLEVDRKVNTEKAAYNGLALIKQVEGEGNLVEAVENIPVDAITEAAILINMERGLLAVSSGTDELLSAHLRYNKLGPAPSIGYETVGRNRLVRMLGMGRDAEWRLLLGETVPITLKVESAGGYREFNFDEVPLAEFELRAMNGPSVIAIPGYQPYLAVCDIEHRCGSISFSADGHFESLASAKISTGRGDIAARFGGFYDRLDHIELSTLNGDLDIDLTGAWQRTCHIRIMGTCGSLRLLIPCGLGVSVRIRHSCADISAPGMLKTWSSKSYINPAYGKSKFFLDIYVDATCGFLEIIPEAQSCPPEAW